MAGITAMGTLSHALETLIERIAGGHVEPVASTLDVVQRSLDQLQQMRDAVAAGRAVAPSDALVGEIERAATSARVPAATRHRRPRQRPSRRARRRRSSRAARARRAGVPAMPAPSGAPPSTPSVAAAPVPAAPAPTIEDTGAIALTAANLEELESIELPSALADDVDAAPQGAASDELTVDEPTAEEEIPEDPTIIQKGDAVASLEMERAREAERTPRPEDESTRPSEAESAPAAVAQPAAADRRTAERAETARVDAGTARRAAEQRGRGQHLPVAARRSR